MELKPFEKPRILMIDDDRDFCTRLRDQLSEWYHISFVHEPESAMAKLHKSIFDLILLDMDLPDISGYELLRMFRVRSIQIPIIMVTGNTDLRKAVDCIRAGANDYVVKDPLNMIDELRFRVDQIFQQIKLKSYTKRLEKKISEASTKYQIIGVSKEILKMKSELLRLAGSNSSVHITGASGSGKELVARNINIQEGDAGRPFISFNCAAIQENLVESELFGHKKGAYTDAKENASGLFLAANNGDIFLDEVGELSLILQKKLLRVIQEREITPVGSTEVIKLNVRIISATNRNLEEEVRLGNFREDLYHRLVVVKIQVPQLRDRATDIPILAQHFLERHIPSAKIGSTALAALKDYFWPNNIRELSNCIEAASLKLKDEGRYTLSKDDLEFRQIESHVRKISVPTTLFPRSVNQINTESFNYTLEWIERKYYEEALSLINNNRTLMAEKLSLSRSYIQKRIKELGMLDDSPFDRGVS